MGDGACAKKVTARLMGTVSHTQGAIKRLARIAALGMHVLSYGGKPIVSLANASANLMLALRPTAFCYPQCGRDTGATCTLLNCAGNTLCDPHSHKCLCHPDSCAYNGVCVQKPKHNSSVVMMSTGNVA